MSRSKLIAQENMFGGHDLVSVSAPTPLPMQYLGCKTRIASWIVRNIQSAFPDCTHFLDLFAGTGAVSLEASASGFSIEANDIQPYAYCVLNSLFATPRDCTVGLAGRIRAATKKDSLLAGRRADASELLSREAELFDNARSPAWDWREYRDFCTATPLVTGSETEVQRFREQNGWNLFQRYYANTYFGVRQCLEIDTLRELAEEMPAPERTHLLAATISAMSSVVSSTTHLAQYLKPSTRVRALDLIDRRSVSVVEEVVHRLKNLARCESLATLGRVWCADYEVVLRERSDSESGSTVVYADPPYFKEHYSRYYHVLDTFYLYDYPELTWNSRTGDTTAGRYRDDRVTSPFGLRAKVEDAFSTLFRLCRQSGLRLALSYAATSLVEKHRLLEIASSNGLDAMIVETSIQHSGQGRPRTREVAEYLFLLAAEG